MAAESNNPTSLPPFSPPTAVAVSRRYRYSSEPVVPVSVQGGAAVVIPGADAVEWGRLGFAGLVGAICFLMLYRSELFRLVERWNSDPGWSHGFVVPIISGFFVWTKWETLRRLQPKGTWLGMVLIVLGVLGQVLFRATGTLQMSDLSIVVLMYGAVLFLFGWAHLKMLWLPISFLLFSMPPPDSMYVAVTTPMQKLAAGLGVELLPFFGAIGFREGTTIQVQWGSSWVPLDVAQACSGMRMLVAFFALAVALAYSTSRPMWQKVFLAVCALPIAILCNSLRVTLTGVLAARWGMEYAKGSTHETLGLLMLIPALFLQLAVGWVLDRIFVEEKPGVGGAT
jgi:exosortase